MCAKFGLNLPVVLEKTMKIWDGYDNDDDNDDRKRTHLDRKAQLSLQHTAVTEIWS